MLACFAEPRCWTGVISQPSAHRNVSDGSDARVAGVIIFQLFFVLILLKRSERTEREEGVTCMFLWCPGMFLRGVLKVGDGGLEESANKQVARGDGGEMPVFVLRQATHTQQMHSTTPLYSSSTLASPACNRKVHIQTYLKKHGKFRQKSRILWPPILQTLLIARMWLVGVKSMAAHTSYRISSSSISHNIIRHNRNCGKDITPYM